MSVPLDMSDVRGQDAAIESLVVALSKPSTRGVVLVGTRTTGIIMLARRVGTVLPELTDDERHAVAAEYAKIGREPPSERPFRAPHHTISTAALVGRRWDYTTERPWDIVPPVGELQLARYGVLMLDGIEEFSRVAIEVLAHDLERLPGRPLVVATTGPCPCGWNGFRTRSCTSPGSLCTCPEATVQGHRERAERAFTKLGINPESDMIRVPFVHLDEARHAAPAPTSESLRRRIELARMGTS